MAIKDALLADYDHEMGTTRRLLERVPGDKLAWKPHDKSRSMGDLAAHVSRIPSWGCIILNGQSFDLSDAPPEEASPASLEAILASFEDTRSRTRASMDKIDGEYNALWTLKRGGYQVFSMPRAAAFRSFVLHHVIHHRGQLSVYLRLNDVLVPPIYGPSADEGS